MKTLYRASRVHTLSYPAVGEWVLVDGRHVERVGIGEAPEADRTLDLPGSTILPGFVDTHVHLTGTGIHHQAPELGSVASATELARHRTGPRRRRPEVTMSRLIISGRPRSCGMLDESLPARIRDAVVRNGRAVHGSSGAR